MSMDLYYIFVLENIPIQSKKHSDHLLHIKLSDVITIIMTSH